MTYEALYRQSIEQPEVFWKNRAEKLSWHHFPPTILSEPEPNRFHWFAGGKMNTSYMALDYHVENGRGDQVAIYYDSPVTGKKEQITYKDLLDKVARFAGVLKEKGVEKGDRVIIYMPMIPETAIAMLACARIGAVHSVVFGGFSAHELAIRIDDAKPKVILAASCGIEIQRIISYVPIVEAAWEEATHKPDSCILFQRPLCETKQTGSLTFYDWEALFATAKPAGYELLDATDPLYILYTSGTTGTPKGIIRDNGGHAVALTTSMEYVYGIQPGEIYWAASDVGWVVGHSYIVYAPLLQGCSTIIFEGKPIKTPDSGTFWRIIEEYKVSVFFTAPTAIRAIKKQDSEGHFLKKYDTSSLRTLFLAGERTDASTLAWASEKLCVPVVDHWWQTESGWPMLANMAGLGLIPIKPGSATKPVFGYDIRSVNNQGENQAQNEEGAIVVKLPLPPGCLPTLWQNDERYQKGYLDPYDGFYFSGDGGYIDEDGYVFITGRMDDIINVAGHRLSTAEMEEVVAAHPSVAECAVIGVADDLKGQIPVGFVVLKTNVPSNAEVLETELIQMVREKIGPVAAFKRSVIAQRLPKTRSGKILRKIMRCIADKVDFKPPSTIEDMSVLAEIETCMEHEGIGAFKV